MLLQANNGARFANEFRQIGLDYIKVPDAHYLLPTAKYLLPTIDHLPSTTIAY